MADPISDLHKLFPPKTDTEARKLAREYNKLLSDSLSSVYKLLKGDTKPSNCDELVKTYELCLGHLESINSQLNCKPHVVQIHRYRLLNIFQRWEQYDEAIRQGKYMFKFIGNLYSRMGTGMGDVPNLGVENRDEDLARFIVNIALELLKCVATARCKNELYVVAVAYDVNPWLSIIGKDEYKKLHNKLVSHLIEFGERVCSSLSSLEEYRLSGGLITRVLGAIAYQCLLRESTSVKFLKFVEYCANQCRNANIDICDALATDFERVETVNTQNLCNNQCVLSVAMAAFTLSFATMKTTEKCTRYVKYLIFTDHLQTKGIKYLDISLRNVGIALGLVEKLRKEHGVDMEFNSLNQELRKIMKLEISKLRKDIKVRLLDKSITNAKKSRAHGIEDLNDSIKSLSEAILIVSCLQNMDEYARDLLAQAYCLRTLFIQEAEPNSKLFVQDIRDALKHWLSKKHPESAEQNHIELLYHVGDLLSLKGYMEDHSKIYEMIFRFFTWKNVSLKDCIAILWQSRSLRHCLCTSPVSDEFIVTLSKHTELSTSMKFWLSCMDKSLEFGFVQSVLVPTLSSPDSYNHKHATQPLATVDDVKQAASDLISNVPASSKSWFLAAHLYYDLCERVITKGSMIEALGYAKEAHLLRDKLFKERFMYSTEQHNDIFGDNGELIKKGGLGLKSFHMYNSVATLAWSSHDMDSSDLVDFILTPWNVLQCYLESILQVGTIQEIIGNGSEAELYFSWGKNVSQFHSLPIFLVSFSSALGQLYCKQRLWYLAETELLRAKKILADSCSLISCSKCMLISKVTIDKYLGDLYQSGNKLHEESETLYRSAIDKLKLPEWKNCVSHPKRVTSRVTRSVVERKVVSVCNGALVEKGMKMSTVGCITSCGCEVTCVYDDSDCLHCLSYGVMKSLSLKSIIQLKWEITRRRFLLRLLTGLGKCLRDIEESQRAHTIFLESISVLVSRSTFCLSLLPESFTFLAELIEKNVTADVFAVEQASLMYTICCFSVRSSWDKGRRNNCCDVSFIPMKTIFSGLKLSFILCREVPELFQEVSRLLCVLYLLSTSNKELSMPCESEALCKSRWASYFLQASIGTNFNYQLFSHLDRSGVTNSTRLSLHRLAPESVVDLEEFIIKFYHDLPRATIVCMSILGDTYARFFRNLMPYQDSAHAWILFSRFNSDNVPIVIALPLDSVLAGSLKDDKDSNSCILSRFEKSSHCSWDHSIVDEVAPLFRDILDQSYVSASGLTLNRSEWWKKRRELDQCLGNLLRDMESLWFGPWKYLLLGDLLDSNRIDSVTKKLMEDLQSKCIDNGSESILRSAINFAFSQHKECLSELILKNGCYIGGKQCDIDTSSQKNSLNLFPYDSGTNATHETGDEDLREPVILVLDFDIQMLPWESMPFLINQEVYRMPSITSISCTYNRCCSVQEKIAKDAAVFPMIDPLDAYYLLNPGGDLPKTEARFKNWFQELNIEGTSGTLPEVGELSMALKKHDLFIYLGHGSGLQYISGDEIENLDDCAATILMGCSSGSLDLNGSYTPTGPPLYLLYAGAPFIVANLWDVTDVDIDKFGEEFIKALLEARSTDCAQCIETAKCKSLAVVDISTVCCKHRPKVGSFMRNARQVCQLPFLNGAAPVCYGIPTGIRKKDM